MYGKLPKKLNEIKINCKEMLFYQYLPIKLINSYDFKYEKRLTIFDELIESCINDFISEFGFEEYEKSYVYLTVKHMYQCETNIYNRLGYHCDGFLTEDINYIWSNNNPTIFNFGKFDLTSDDTISMVEMNNQALKENEITFENNTILRLDQYNIHKVNDEIENGMRTFFKLSFSKDKYDLIGNSHNYDLDYVWIMKERKVERNIPQSI